MNDKIATLPHVIIKRSSDVSDEYALQMAIHDWTTRAQSLLDTTVKENSVLLKWLVNEQVQLLLAANKHEINSEITVKMRLPYGKIEFILQNND